MTSFACVAFAASALAANFSGLTRKEEPERTISLSLGASTPAQNFAEIAAR